MKKPKFSIIVTILLILAFAAIVFATAEVFIFKNHTLSLEEGGILEMTQVAILAGTVILYLIAVARNKGNERWISLFFVGIFYLFMIRELDIKNWDISDSIKAVFYKPGRAIVSAIILTTAFIGAIMNYKHYFNKTVSLLFSKRGALLWGAFIFLQLGQWSEKSGLTYAVYGEETLELVGYCLLLICAYQTKQLPAYDAIFEKAYSKDEK